LQIVCAALGVDPLDVKRGSRKTEIKNARHFYCYYACLFTKKSLASIGKFVNRHHTSVLHGRQTIEDFIEVADRHTMECIRKINTYVTELEQLETFHPSLINKKFNLS
jgi:chromosomal replication initiation ATPase DnaA